MLSAIRRRLTYGNVAMTVALVFAMSGGAFAAGKFLITSTKQISPKVLKSLQGKAGPAGVAGAQGPAGPAGPQGPAGPAGPAGALGAKGETGPEGKEGKAGKDGKNGQTGFTETLPSGKTETGVWSFGPTGTSTPPAGPKVPIASFVIPLAVPLTNAEECGESGKPECQAHYINEDRKEIIGNFIVYTERAPSAACPGSVSTPSAAPGNLCVYAGYENETATGPQNIFDPGQSSAGASTTGAVAVFRAEAESHSEARGTWAVTAE